MGLMFSTLFSLGVFVTRHFTLFFQAITLPETPQYVFAICIILASIYIVKKGIETLGRWSLFSLPFIIFIFLLTIIFSVYLYNPANLKPLFQSDFSLIADNAFNSYSLPFGESVLFLLLFDSLQNGKKSLRVFYISLAIGVTVIMLAVFRNILVLGVENNRLLVSPSVGAVSIIQIISFVERIEVIITIMFIICGVVKVSACLIGASKGTAKLLKLDSDRPMIVPLGLLMLMLACNVFESLSHIVEWFNAYRVFFIPVQIIFPLATWITAEIKLKRQPKS